MKSLNNELTVYRGETFSIDKSVQNKDGSPYIISKQLNNPYFLLSVSSTRYEQENRYVKNYWLDLSDFPRFSSTRAFDLKSLMSTANGSVPMYANGFDDITERKNNDTLGDYIAYGYINNNLVSLDYDDCVFYVEDEEERRTYKYWDISSNMWNDYKCKIVKSFRQEDTRKWTEQSYVYSITLVSGQLMSSYLNQLCTDNNIDFNNITDREKYEKLVEAGQTFPTDFNIDRILVRYDTVMPILIPTKISVLSVINGGIK